jgi:RNA polymerase II C-terminal domain phosphatase-like 3/4
MMWKMAEHLGAVCSTDVDPTVTHVVAVDLGTEKARWAVKNKKFLVHPRWIEAANFRWHRQPEEDFPVIPPKEKSRDKETSKDKEENAPNEKSRDKETSKEKEENAEAGQKETSNGEKEENVVAGQKETGNDQEDNDVAGQEEKDDAKENAVATTATGPAGS